MQKYLLAHQAMARGPQAEDPRRSPRSTAVRVALQQTLEHGRESHWYDIVQRAAEQLVRHVDEPVESAI